MAITVTVPIQPLWMIQFVQLCTLEKNIGAKDFEGVEGYIGPFRSRSLAERALVAIAGRELIISAKLDYMSPTPAPPEIIEEDPPPAAPAN